MASKHAFTGFAWPLVWLLLVFRVTAAATPLDDPTRPAGWRETPGVVESTPPPVFRVSLLKLSPSLRLAVVNGRSVRVGDEVDGARVAAIGRDGVELEYGGMRLRLAPPSSATEIGVIRLNGPLP